MNRLWSRQERLARARLRLLVAATRHRQMAEAHSRVAWSNGGADWTAARSIAYHTLTAEMCQARYEQVAAVCPP